MEKTKLLKKHIKIGTIYYYFSNVFATASEPRKICKIEGEKFYYGTNASEYNVIKDISLYLIRLPIERFECSETTSLLSNEATYKVGDYIVCLDNANPNPSENKSNPGGMGFVKNKCFKIVRITNIDECQILFCENHINGIYNNSVRPATEREIAKYNLLGSHYDVVSDSLIGRYVKALKDSINRSGVQKDQIYKIINESFDSITLDLIIYPYISKNSLYLLEIMPIGYNQQKSLEGRYLKALVNRPNGGEVKAGEFGLIKSNKQVNFDSQEGYYCENVIDYFTSNTIERFYKNKYELMPEGFTPNSINSEEEFKTGDWIIRESNELNLPNITIGKMYKAGEIISNKNIVYVVDDDEALSRFHLNRFRKATKGEIDSFIGNIPKPGEWVYFYEFDSGCSGVGEVNQAYLVTDNPSKRGLINKNYTNFNVLDDSGVSWEVNGRYATASPEEVDFAIRKASLHRMNVEKITSYQFEKYALRGIETGNSYNNYGAAMKQPEETNSSLTNSNSEKVIKLIKPQPKKMSIDSVLSMDINLRTNKKTTQIKI